MVVGVAFKRLDGGGCVIGDGDGASDERQLNNNCGEDGRSGDDEANSMVGDGSGGLDWRGSGRRVSTVK